MKYHGQIALRSPTGGMILPLRSEYDRQLVFEHITDRVRREQWVDVSLAGQHWRAMLVAPDAKLTCTSCAEPLSIAHASAGRRLCTRCRMRTLH